MVDAADLKSVSSNGVRVQVPPRALFCIKVKMLVNQKIWASDSNRPCALNCVICTNLYMQVDFIWKSDISRG